MAEDPTVDSIEVDCLEHAEMSLPQGDDSFPGGDSGMPDLDEAVARRLTVHDGAPWGLDRIDGVDDNSYDDGDLTGGGTGVRVYIVDSGIQGTHVDFGNRVVNGYTVRAAQVSACKGSSRPCHPRLPARCSTPTRPHTDHTQRCPNAFPCPSLLAVPQAERVRLVPSGQRHPPGRRRWMRRARHPRGLDRRRPRLRRRKASDASSGFLVLQGPPMLERAV